MAIMKKNELKAMDAAALQKKLEELEAEIFSGMGAIRSTGKPSNPKYREIKRLRATIKQMIASTQEKP